MATSTRTAVFTDLSNYTASVARVDRETLRNLLATHEATVAPLLRRHHGRIVKSLGDSFMALFDSATDAVRAGLDIVQEGTLPIRVSAATGDVEEIEEDVFGEAVNLASRINHLMPASEVWFSESTLLCLKMAEIPWEQVGFFALKGIVGEVPLYRAVPSHRAWLPEPIVVAARNRSLAIIGPDGQVPALAPEPTLIIQGHEVGSDSLTSLLERLPVVDPARIWLNAYTVAPGDRHLWERQMGHRFLIGMPQAIEESIRNATRFITQAPSSDTIILETGIEHVLELGTTGIALPEVPMSDVVAGYSYDLLADGRWVNRAERPLVRVQVGPKGVAIQATSPGVFVDGKLLTDQEQLPLRDGAGIVVGERRFAYRALANSPFFGLLFSEPQTRLVIAGGQVAEVGREPTAPGIAVPDRKGQQNILWSSGARAARARESGFTLDRALTGRRQASVRAQGPVFVVEALHERCLTYLYRGTGELERVQPRASAEIGHSIIIGTSIVTLNPPPR